MCHRDVICFRQQPGQGVGGIKGRRGPGSHLLSRRELRPICLQSSHLAHYRLRFAMHFGHAQPLQLLEQRLIQLIRWPLWHVS